MMHMRCERRRKREEGEEETTHTFLGMFSPVPLHTITAGGKAEV
jgi:hypothetical protein